MLKIETNATLITMSADELEKLRDAVRKGLVLIRREIAKTDTAACLTRDGMATRLELISASHALNNLLNTLAS